MRKEKHKSIIPGDSLEYCYICGRWMPKGLQEHHCIPGYGNRPICTKYGLIVHLCPECHHRVHEYNEHMMEIRKTAQRTFEEHHSREKWMVEFGKNYL